MKGYGESRKCKHSPELIQPSMEQTFKYRKYCHRNVYLERKKLNYTTALNEKVTQTPITSDHDYNKMPLNESLPLTQGVILQMMFPLSSVIHVSQ